MLDPIDDGASSVLVIVVTFSVPVAVPIVFVAATTVPLVVVIAYDDFRSYQDCSAEVVRDAHRLAFYEVSKRQGMVAVRNGHARRHADGHPVDHHRAWRGNAVDRSSHLRLVAVCRRGGPLGDGNAGTRIGDAHRHPNLLPIL